MNPLSHDADVYRFIMKHTSALMWMFDENNVCVFMNDAAITTFGFSLEQETQSRFEQYVHPDDLPTYVGALQVSASTQPHQPYINEYRIRRSDGRFVWLDDHSVPCFDDADNFRGYLSTCEDCDERKTAESKQQEELQAREARLSAANNALAESQHGLEKALAAEREQRSLIEALHEITLTINRSLDLDEVLYRILLSVRRVVPHRASIFMMAEGDRAVARATAGFESHPALHESMSSLSLSIDKTPTLHQMMVTGEPQIIADVNQHDGWITFSGKRIAFCRAYIGIPVFLHDRLIGFLQLFSGTTGFFNATHAERLRLFAGPMTTAIHNANLYQQAQEAATNEERQRIAHEIHDTITQTLFTSRAIAEMLPRMWDRKPERVLPQLEILSALNRSAQAEMRLLLMELRPEALVQMPMVDQYQQLVDALQGRKQIAVSLQVQDQTSPPPDVQLALYRIAQEALTNVAKYAEAAHVEIQVSCSDHGAYLTIRDDGRGFDPNTTGIGIRDMKARAANVGAALRIESQPGHGTRITVTWTPNS